MTDLKTRITRLEQRVKADESPAMTLMEFYHSIKETDPEYARRVAEEGDTLMQQVLTSPTPKRIRRKVLAEKRKEASTIANRNERIAPTP